MAEWRSFRLRRGHKMEQIAPATAVAGIDLHNHADARKQRPIRIDIIKLKTHRQTLDDLDPIPGRILGRQNREIRSSARTHANDVRPKRAIRIGIDADRRLLAWTHVSETRLAEIRLDPDAPARQQRKHGGAGIDEVADLQVVNPCYGAVVGRDHRGIGEIKPGAVELCPGCANRRMTIDLDVWIAVQRSYRIADLLFDR